MFEALALDTLQAQTKSQHSQYTAGLFPKRQNTADYEKTNCFGLALVSAAPRFPDAVDAGCRRDAARGRLLCILCYYIQTEPLTWKMWFVCNKAMRKKQNKTYNKMSRGKIHAAQTPELIWHISEPLKPRSLTDRREPVMAGGGWKTDSVSQSRWCTWQLLVVLHVISGAP